MEAELRSDALINSRFQIVEILGSGASGAVYRARDLLLSREVALKFADEPIRENCKQFVRELVSSQEITH